jgi:hypothetical protein
MLVVILSVVILLLSIYNLSINVEENSNTTRDIVLYISTVLSTMALAISIYDMYKKQFISQPVGSSSGIKDFEEMLNI